MRLWLVRHARPLVAQGICYGQSDIAADAQATRLAAQALAQALPRQAHIRCSPLQRCEQIRHVLQGLRPDVVCKLDARLMEMDFGCWEGRRWDDLPRDELDNWTAHFPSHACGGGESVQQVMARVAAVWDETCALAAEGGPPMAWITHAGVVRAATLLAQGQRQLARADQWPREAPDFGGWCTVALWNEEPQRQQAMNLLSVTAGAAP